MTMALGTYGPAWSEFLNADIDMIVATIKLMLTQDAYTPDFDLHDFLADASANRVTGSTDQTLANKVITVDTTNDQVEFDNTVDITWSAVPGGETVGGVVLYRDSGAEATSEVVAAITFTGGTIPTNGSDITVTPHADGLFKVNY